MSVHAFPVRNYRGPDGIVHAMYMRRVEGFYCEENDLLQRMSRCQHMAMVLPRDHKESENDTDEDVTCLGCLAAGEQL